MIEYKNMNIHGSDVVFGFVDFLPMDTSTIGDAVMRIAAIENISTKTEIPFHSVMQGSLCVAMLSQGTVYAPYAMKDDQAQLESLKEEVYTYLFRKGDYYREDQLKQGYNLEVNAHGIRLHDQVMKDGFAMQAYLYNHGEYCCFTTVGLAHQNLPELLIFGDFQKHPDAMMHVMRLVHDYMEKHGARHQVYEAGTIHETHRLRLNFLDQQDETNQELMFAIREYWQDVEVEVAQVVLSNVDSLLPDEDGYCQHCLPQPVLASKVYHA
ncbi:TPA: DUF4262 domain-containing protein [Vibrio parahaemolyticus]|nr:DUF4262 domain-containing protein [Vibrio parahaemolyticus]